MYTFCIEDGGIYLSLVNVLYIWYSFLGAPGIVYISYSLRGPAFLYLLYSFSRAVFSCLYVLYRYGLVERRGFYTLRIVCAFCAAFCILCIVIWRFALSAILFVQRSVIKRHHHLYYLYSISLPKSCSVLYHSYSLSLAKCTFFYTIRIVLYYRTRSPAVQYV